MRESIPIKKKALRAVAVNDAALEALATKNSACTEVLKKVPRAVRDEAMIDLVKAYKSNFSKGGPFFIHFRSRKHMPQQSIVIQSRDWMRMRGQFAFLKTIPSAETLPPNLNGFDTRIVLVQRTMEFYVCLLSPLEIWGENQAPASQRVVAVDPGMVSLFFLLLRTWWD